MADLPILGPQQPSERERLALLRGLTGRQQPEDEGLILPPGYERKKNKRSGRSRKKAKRRK